MPTGYTAKIATGISFKEFAMDCARAFGACVDLRDDPNKEIPTEVKPSKYHIEELKKAKRKLKTIKKMSLAEARKRAKKEFLAKIEYNKEAIEHAHFLRKQYENMLSMVEKWEPPTDEHKNLKKFMKEQITESIEFDCDTKYHIEDSPTLMSPEEWLSEKTKKLIRDIDYHTKGYAQDVDRAKRKTEWIQSLRDSLKG